MGETSADTLFGRLVIEKSLCTSAEVQECLDFLKQSAAKDKPISLPEALLAKGYLTRSQMQRMSSEIRESRPTQQIPGFQMLERLGAGAMATVFKAKQLSLDREVAIKVLPRRLSENGEYVERFYQEGRAAAKLNHRNIVQAIDVGEANGLHYFVMEYVRGKTVYDDIKDGKPYSEADALDIIIQIAEALEHAHEKGLIHRDVKPKNIMITPNGVAKLADMGLAREAADNEAAQSEMGRAYGTPYYISPEQIRGELDIDFRADIYSLGATLYHMITGRVPFEGSTPSAVMHKHLKETLVPPDHLNAKLSVGIAEVVEVMMAKNRDDRYANVTMLLQDLRAIRKGEPPLQAHRKFDANALADLERNSPETDAGLEEVLQPQTALGVKIALLLLIASLVICILIIIVLMTNKK